jgi:glycine/D-amino acid oxidase-like deaminating enzyme
MTSRTFDLAIIGAGIVGAACADEASRAGMNVAIIDCGVIGGGATAAGMGHIVVMDDSDAQFALTRYSQQLWDELAAELPPDVEYDRCGTIWVAADEEEMAEVTRKEALYRSREVPVEVLDARTLAGAEPNLRPLAGGLLVSEDSVIYPPCAARWLVERSLSRGASLFSGSRVTSIEENGAMLDDGTLVSAGAVVSASGSWAPELTPGLEVKKRKGHLVITNRYPGFVRHQLVELGYLKSAHSVTSDSVAFNVQPRRTGQVLIGSSRQYGEEASSVDTVILSRMLSRAEEYMPGIGKLSAIRVWTGFRAATPDKLPLIGQCPGKDRLYLATGHEGLGITTSLATGRLLIDQIVGRDSAIPREPYLPERLA